MKKNNLIRVSISLACTLFLYSCATLAPTATEQSNSSTSQSEPKSNSEKDKATARNDSDKPVPFVNPGDGGATNSAKTSKPAFAGAPASAPVAETTTGDVSDSATLAPMPASAGGSTVGGISKEESDRITSSPIIAPQPAKKLSAGNIDDNDKFSEYLEYLNKYGPTFIDKRDVLKVDISNRYIINVHDKDNKSISDAVVEITSNNSNVFTGKTYAHGKTLFFPTGIKSINSDCQQQDCTSAKYSVTVKKGNLKQTKEFTLSENRTLDFTLTDKRDVITTPNLDILFLIDATGSMGDEIASIQKTIKDIASRISSLELKPNIRYSLVSYKDRNDDYRVKRYDFTSNLNYFQEILNELSAGGGGDYPESLNEGLYHSIHKVTWSNDKDAVRLVFLIADAPPHLDYSDDYKYTDEMVEAVKQGIKIYPVASSGLSENGEYIFRQLAQFTYSKFLFLTYGGDEQTPGTTPHNVGEFKENNLDDLVVNIVKEELNYLK